MSEDWQSIPVKTTHRMRRVITYAFLLLTAFLLGFVPMWWFKSQCSSSLAEAERQSSLARMQNSLASAAIDARRGDFETARLAASDFFTALRVATSTGVDSVLPQAQKDGAQPLLAQRDQTITLLARGDVSSADLLSDLYVSFRQLINP
jgi:hypothetical protein